MIIHLIQLNGKNFVNWYIGKKCIMYMYIVIHQSEFLCGVFGFFLSKSALRCDLRLPCILVVRESKSAIQLYLSGTFYWLLTFYAKITSVLYSTSYKKSSLLCQEQVLLAIGGYSSVVEHSTADREVHGSTPCAPFKLFVCLNKLDM